MKQLLSIILQFLTYCSHAQQNTFTRIYSNGLDTSYFYKSIIENPNGTFTMGGSLVYSTMEPRDWYRQGYLLMVVQDGYILWDRILFFEDSSDLQVESMILTKNGNYLICGFIEDFPNSGFDETSFAIKMIDQQGRKLWEGRYGIYEQRNWAYSLAQADDKSYLISGRNNLGMYIVL